MTRRQRGGDIRGMQKGNEEDKTRFNAGEKPRTGVERGERGARSSRRRCGDLITPQCQSIVHGLSLPAWALRTAPAQLSHCGPGPRAKRQEHYRIRVEWIHEVNWRPEQNVPCSNAPTAKIPAMNTAIRCDFCSHRGRRDDARDRSREYN